MYLLGIETTGAFASVSLLDTEGGTIDVIHGNDRFSHLQNLTPQIETVLKRGALTVRDLDGIAVSRGPGSFTGIRIGVSTTRALSQILKIPCMAVSSLEALALRAFTAGASDAPKACQREHGEDGPAFAGADRQDVLICPILDARRKQVYGAGYRIRAAGRSEDAPAAEAGGIAAGIPVLEEVVPAGSYLIGEFLDLIEEHPVVLFLGDGIDTCGEEIRARRDVPEETAALDGIPQTASEAGKAAYFVPEEIRYQDAGTAVLRGLQLMQEGKTCGYMELQPDYMRMAEAERKLREKQAKEAEAARKAVTEQGAPAERAERTGGERNNG